MTKTLTVTLNLRPGDSVIIDSGQYYVYYQNGVDITDNASGDWPDSLDRNTQQIEVSCNQSSASAEIAYTERYL